MIEPGFAPARRDREIHARVVEHPFGIVVLAHRRFGGEQGGVEADRLIEIVDRDMDMQAFHGTHLSVQDVRLLARAGLEAFGLAGWHTSGAHFSCEPWQQFSVRKPSSAFMVANCAA